MIRSATRVGVVGSLVVTVMLVGAAGYALGAAGDSLLQAQRRAHFVDRAPVADPVSSPSPTKPDRPGQPSATGEDGRAGRSPENSKIADKAHRKKKKRGGCPKGPQHRKVEARLDELGGFGKVVVDGRQTVADCRAIKKFQRRYGIYPTNGYAGPVTAGIAKRLLHSNLKRCDSGSKITVCVDLAHQTMWVVRGDDIVLPPTVVRTGRSGLGTPAGHHKITEKKRTTTSSYYDVALPYWQRFVSDIGFHQTPSYLHEGPGSHGCVNVLHRDVVKLWNLTRVGTKVHVFGRKPV